ncbi:hypothetical protein VNO77_42404 [Canavalia gladiata]|uniref:Knottins-like domain-containing protein n=1 Tax=Canavalia gladiata TaxID=3824 RepID=A0AAN9JSS6_CANGL
MPSSASKFFTIFLLLCLPIILFSAWEVQANVCERRSTLWSGPCIDTGRCKNQCINVERAIFGACQRDGYGYACFCFFDC